jgi:hypothetical protein
VTKDDTKPIIGQLVAMPWDPETWVIGMVVEHRFSLGRHFYDIEWYTPNGRHTVLSSYNAYDVNAFIKKYHEMCRGDKPNDKEIYDGYLQDLLYASGEP